MTDFTSVCADRRASLAGLMTLAVGLLNPSLAAAQHRDVLLSASDGRLVTGAYDWGAQRAIATERVFSRSFEYAEEDYAASSNPGFNAIEQPPEGLSSLPGTTPVRLTLREVQEGRNLSYWDGTLPVAFGPAPGKESFVIASASDAAQVRVTGDHRNSDPLTLAVTLDNGVLHEHPTLLLLGDGSAQAGQGQVPPAEGIYALAFTLSAEGLQESHATYLLMAHGPSFTSKLTKAEDWFHEHLVPDCLDGKDNDLDGKRDYPEDEECLEPDAWCEGASCGDASADAGAGPGSSSQATSGSSAGGDGCGLVRPGELPDGRASWPLALLALGLLAMRRIGALQ